jgi:hypothetical protein
LDEALAVSCNPLLDGARVGQSVKPSHESLAGVEDLVARTKIWGQQLLLPGSDEEKNQKRSRSLARGREFEQASTM